MDNSQLTIADLSAIHKMIETACERGTFKASEIRQVGEIYDKLSSFLSNVQSQFKAQSAPSMNIGELPPEPTQGDF